MRRTKNLVAPPPTGSTWLQKKLGFDGKGAARGLVSEKAELIFLERESTSNAIHLPQHVKPNLQF
jgi:hypothetical protein